jgi:hypothetical protein
MFQQKFGDLSPFIPSFSAETFTLRDPIAALRPPNSIDGAKKAIAPLPKRKFQPLHSTLQLPNLDFQPRNSEFRVQNRNFQLQNSKLPLPNSKLPLPNSKLSLQNLKLPLPNSKLQLNHRIDRWIWNEAKVPLEKATVYTQVSNLA